MTTSLRSFTLALPVGLPLLNANQRPHHRVRAKLTKDIRAAAMTACSEDPSMRAALTAAGSNAVLRRAWIFGVYHPGRGGRCDPANWYPSFKAAVDGIVEAGVLEDDDHTRVIGPDMRLGDVVRGGRIVLHIHEMTPAGVAIGAHGVAL